VLADDVDDALVGIGSARDGDIQPGRLGEEAEQLDEHGEEIGLRDYADEAPVHHDREAADLLDDEEARGLLDGRLRGDGGQLLAHELDDARPGEPGRQEGRPEITVREDAHEPAVLEHGQVPEAPVPHEPVGLARRRPGAHGDEVGDHDIANGQGHASLL